MHHDLLIKGGQVVDPAAGYDGRIDVAIDGGFIAAVDADIPEESAFRVIDARGSLVLPGLVDLHTHTFHGFSFWASIRIRSPRGPASRRGTTPARPAP